MNMKSVLSAPVLSAILVAGMLSACGKKEDATVPPPPPVASNATNQPVAAAAPNPAFAKLKGKWLRPDGGYILEIRSVDAGGKMDAAYFNPRPINVAKAEAVQEDGMTKVFIELRDVNYPGSLYKLGYKPASDQLEGIYYQAALQEQFEVIFQRVK